MGVNGLIGPGEGKSVLIRIAASASEGEGRSALDEVSLESAFDGPPGPDESPEEELSSWSD